MDPALLADVNLDEEHVVAKVQRLLDALLHLGDGLSVLGAHVELRKSPDEIVGFDRVLIAAEGWRPYPVLGRLAQVAPLDMTQQAFLARCKGLHEVWQRIPNGFLKGLLERAGCPRAAVQPLASIKLLQGLFNVVGRLNEHEERIDAFRSGAEPEGWRASNELMAPLFLNNDLRIADAHDSFAGCLATLQSLGFDVANVNSGYGRALDFVMDGVIASLNRIAVAVHQLVARQ
jgi:hypothetical protein